MNIEDMTKAQVTEYLAGMKDPLPKVTPDSLAGYLEACDFSSSSADEIRGHLLKDFDWGTERPLWWNLLCLARVKRTQVPHPWMLFTRERFEDLRGNTQLLAGIWEVIRFDPEMIGKI